MKLSYTICALVAILQSGLIGEYLGYAEHVYHQLCNKIISYQESRRVPYLETYKEKKWGIFYKTKTRWNYRIEYYTSWRKEPTCCDGYRQTVHGTCDPTCQPACGNGTCVKPNVCICDRGYAQERDIVFDSVCIPACTHACVHGRCTAPEVCTCDHGYSMSADGCKPICGSGCGTGSYCSRPNICACLAGYVESIDSRYVAFGIYKNHCKPICDNECANGKCTAPNACTCDDAYEPDPDDLFVCKPKCAHGCLYGTCTAPDVCTCDEGYSLKSAGVCEPVCSEACVMGTCVAPESCKCFEGYGLLESSKYVCEPVCERACLNGRCIAPGLCTCNKGFQLTGDESAKHICEPYCEISCEPFGVCTAPGVCACFEGYRLADAVRVKKTAMKYFADNSMCEPICGADCINGFCSAPGTCSCYPGYHSLGANATDVCKPTCTQDCAHGFCSAPETCTCDAGYRPSKNTSHVCEPICATGCVNGHCSAPNECTCDPGYEAAEDSRASPSTRCVPTCDPSCVNGVCVEPDVCNCSRGYRKSSSSSANACDPVCRAMCERMNGVCVAPDLCECKDGYQKVHFGYAGVPFRCRPICNNDCGNGTCTAPDLCVCHEGYRNAVTGGCVPVCAGCDNGTCVAPEICECDDGFVLVESNDWESGSEDRSGNGSRCAPRCENCDNGECAAPDECRCRAGFARVEGSCVNACEGGCGIHGECIDERRTCECNYGWSGMRCDRPTLCVVILNDEEGNLTESLRIVEEQNATIEYVFRYNPSCSKCINIVNNETLCFNTHINDTKDEAQIGCLLNRDCLKSQYEDQRKMIKLTAIISSSVLLLLLFLTGAAITICMLQRRLQSRRLDLDNTHRTSMQGLVE